VIITQLLLHSPNLREPRCSRFLNKSGIT
jgi:hypothetical protein